MILKIGIIDYGMGNINSVFNAIQVLGYEAVFLKNPDMITEVDKVILPGVGAFGEGMKKLEESNWVNTLKNECKIGMKPLLGICLGMQLLASEGNEFGHYKGLNFISGKVEKLSLNEKKYRLPHIGWNTVKFASKSNLYNNLGEERDFYFVHSYVFIPNNEKDISGVCNHGTDFVASIENKNIFGTQFHPEKSHKTGLAVLNNFIQYEVDLNVEK